MKSRGIVLLAGALLLAGEASATNYAYSVYNPSGAAFPTNALSSFTQNGSITCSTFGSTCQTYSTSTTGGSAIYTSGVPSEYENRIVLGNGLGTGGAVLYVHASTTALSTFQATADAGTFDAFHVYTPFCATDGNCSAYWAFYERKNGQTSLIGNGSVPFWNGMAVRIVTYGTTVAVLANDQFMAFAVTLTGGYPGIGAWGNQGGAITAEQIGPRCMTVPNTVYSQNAAVSAYPTNVSINWPETTQPADVAAIGITEWYTARDGVFYGQTNEAAAWSDPNVTPSTTHTYAVAPVSFHGVSAAYSSTISVTTPSSLNVDPVRTGVRPLGAYWGSAPENIDMASGNLNLTVPLLHPQGRGGWTVPIALTYNSQIWKKDSAGTHNLGVDTGYGYGWKLLAGSLTPYWNSQTLQIDHYLYIDSTGGEYRLYPSGSAHIWVSHLYPISSGLSGEGIYVYYDSSANVLHFRDGSSWVMGSMSSGEEQDAGTLYPTIMEDRNGNEVILTYAGGLGANSSLSPTAVSENSSSRITNIEDTRAVGFSQRSTYAFTYGAPDAKGIQHLSGITNGIGTDENYSFAYEYISFTDPWNQGVNGTSTGLANITNTSENVFYKIWTDSYGQMLKFELPYGGYLRWSYTTNTYTWNTTSPSNTISLNAINGRYLAAAANSTNTQSPTEWSYSISYDAPLLNESVVQKGCASDTAAGSKWCWLFANGGSTGLPVTTEIQRFGTVGGTSTQLQDQTLAYTQDSAGNPFPYQVLTNSDPGTPSQVYSQSQQTLDQYGNVVSSAAWDYSTSLPGATPARTWNTTFKNNCSAPWTGLTNADCPYVNQFLLSLPVTETVTNGSSTVTLQTNTYDSYGTYPLVSPTNMNEFDSAYESTSVIVRGNVTKTVTPSSTMNIGYDVSGITVASDDDHGHDVSITPASGTNNSAPGTIQPNTGQANDSNLQTVLNYTPFLGVSSAVGPNGSTTNIVYDSIGRPTSSVSPTNDTTTYSYVFGSTVNGHVSDGPYTTTATTNGHWVTTVTDGLGRAVATKNGYGASPSATQVSEVESVYQPCACSPAGKLTKTSQPYGPSGTAVYTINSYDGLGRTSGVLLPDGASKTTYLYQGN